MRAGRETDGKRPRNSNLECLRIVSALLIIAYHMKRIGWAEKSQPPIVYASAVALGSWGILGVDLFLIIGAWFLVGQKFRARKVAALVFQTFTYVSAYAVFYLLWEFSRGNLRAALLEVARYEFLMVFQPLWAKCYWFVTTYFFLLILSPFLNRILRGVTRKDLERILLTLAFIPLYAQFDTSPVCDVVLFAYAYLLVGYIKLYRAASVMRRVRPQYALAISGVIVSANLLLYFTDDSWFGKSVELLLRDSVGAIGRHSLMIMLDAMMIFFSVLRCPPRHSGLVNALAECTLGAYLFHENNVLFMPATISVIQEKLSRAGFYQATIWFPAQYFAVTASVFLVGAGIERLRQLTLQRPAMALADRKFSKVFDKIDDWMNADFPRPT